MDEDSVASSTGAVAVAYDEEEEQGGKVAGGEVEASDRPHVDEEEEDYSSDCRAG